MKPFNYSYTDERGVEHFYPKHFTWHCTIHDRVCSPTTPLTKDDLLRLVAMAAKDKALGDDAFAVLAPAVEGREVTS